MSKFVNQVVFVDDEKRRSQLEFDTNVLSAAIVYMADYYKGVFDGLDAVLKAASPSNDESTPVQRELARKLSNELEKG